MAELTIAQLAQAGGVGVETIRYYQRRGLLLTPARPHNGIRRYDDVDVQRLRFIRAAQVAGFSLKEVAELIALEATDDRPRARALARERIKALDATIADLNAARDSLARLERDCATRQKGPCPIFSAFNQPSPPRKRSTPRVKN